MTNSLVNRVRVDRSRRELRLLQTAIDAWIVKREQAGQVATDESEED